MMPVVVTLAAYSDTGKTTYLEKLIPRLKTAGLRVAVIKHDGHDFQMDREGKDTWRFAQAGADAVAIASAAKFALCRQHLVGLEDIVNQLSDMDLILTEGYKTGPYPKIALFRAASGKDLAAEPPDCIAIVSDVPLEAGCPVFPLDDPAPLAAFLLQRVLTAKHKSNLERIKHHGNLC